MSENNFEIVFPSEVVAVDTIQEASTNAESSNPVDYVLEHPVGAPVTLLAVVAAGLLIRKKIVEYSGSWSDFLKDR